MPLETGFAHHHLLPSGGHMAPQPDASGAANAGRKTQTGHRKPLLLKENTMRSVDFSPLYRSTVGFDRLFSLLDGMAQADQAQAYPPYNIERTGETTYRISMAVAGFDEDELVIETKPNLLTVTGKKAEAEGGQDNAFLYRGIANRGFERRFHTADYVEVTGASLKHGLLHIDLKREIPEALKPRRIAIDAAKAPQSGAKVIEAKAA
jgi:molecular chaperone IbpA